mgnify:CR=1 FL=1
MPYAPVRNGSIYYRDVGQGEPLILVPGLGGDSRAFNPLLPFIRKEGLRFVTLDPRGLGRSQGKPEDFTMGQMVLDLLGIMDHLGIKEAFFLGASLGALVVRSLALSFPGRLKGLILCTPPATVGPAADEWSQGLLSLLSHTPHQEIMLKLLESMVAPRYLERNKGILQDLALHYKIDERTRLMMIRQLEVLRGQKEAWVLPGIPCLILGGKQDRLVRVQDLQKISSCLPQSRLVLLEGVGHHLALEAPWRVAREVAGFVAAVTENSRLDPGRTVS